MICRAVPNVCAGLTSEKLREDGIFLWTNGLEAILFFGQRVPPPLIHATVGGLRCWACSAHALSASCSLLGCCPKRQMFTSIFYFQKGCAGQVLG